MLRLVHVSFIRDYFLSKKRLLEIFPRVVLSDCYRRFFRCANLSNIRVEVSKQPHHLHLNVRLMDS